MATTKLAKYIPAMYVSKVWRRTCILLVHLPNEPYDTQPTRANCVAVDGQKNVEYNWIIVALGEAKAEGSQCSEDAFLPGSLHAWSIYSYHLKLAQ